MSPIIDTHPNLSGRSHPASASRYPGEVGAWFFYFLEMFIFGYLFVAFSVDRARHRDLFETSRHALDANFGAANTLILLTSSLFVYLAVHSIRLGRLSSAGRYLSGTLFLGLTFCVSKGFEYHSKIALGLTPETNIFFSWYYVLTGLHLLHVLGGMTLLCFVLASVRRGDAPRNMRLVEVAACFWHMVDLLWIVIFPLLYLVK